MQQPPPDDSFWSNKGTIYSYLFPSTSPTTTGDGQSSSGGSGSGSGGGSSLDSVLSAIQSGWRPAVSSLFTVDPERPFAHTFSVPFPSVPSAPRLGVISSGRGKVTAVEVEGFEVRSANFKIETDSPLLSVLVTAMILHYLYVVFTRKSGSAAASTAKQSQGGLANPHQSSAPAAAAPPQPYDPPADPPTLNQYYVIQTTTTPDTFASPQRLVYADPHNVWVRSLESSGVLFLGGDLTETAQAASPTNGEEVGVAAALETMYIIRAKSLAHATTIASTDPYNENCVCNYRVYPWAVETGQVGVRIGLGGCEYRLE